MEAASKTPASLSLPWKTRLAFSAFGTITHAARRRDGTINRGLLNFFLSKVPPSSKPIKGVKTYDVTVDPTRNLWFRVFVPTEHAVQDLPLIVFIHGGGFAFLSADEKHNDDVCREMARKVPALIVSVEYRVTPEHRYPAQHDDCFDVLKFLDDDQNRSKCSLENANISRCFIVGDSSGGNIAHHVAQRACEFNFQRLKVIGLVAIQPFFGGEERSNSEKELAKNTILSLDRADWYWNAFLPQSEGYNRDHPIINVCGPRAVDISKMDFPPTMVVVGGFDLLQDWQRRYYEWLKKSGKEAYLVEYPNMPHSFFTFQELPESGQAISEIKDFIHKVLEKVTNE
ncbi:putative carboxylesterase [Helianthus annuus]|uniref:probable carboxylesterase 18 isoform X2 n=1 Tax=Helianthus annuus TaxID=4232 RepID=UPI000B8F93C0|nr:probable carboxylesterase 18 isoform X2 [Helianthus annuus]KAJ0569495.1 putative carboxylesterase [Helianthus annuus]KAJ0583805.1 putative carboxylesterase [Helianthus annuus]